MRSSEMPLSSLSSDVLAHSPARLLSVWSLTRPVTSRSAWSTCQQKSLFSSGKAVQHLTHQNKQSMLPLLHSNDASAAERCALWSPKKGTI